MMYIHNLYLFFGEDMVDIAGFPSFLEGFKTSPAFFGLKMMGLSF